MSKVRTAVNHSRARWVPIAVVTAVIVAAFTGPASAAEQRCGELGGNCVCSEPLNTTDLPKVQGSWYNPGDSTSQECSSEGIKGGAISRNASDLSGSNDAAAMAALPPGHTNNYFVRGPEGHLGIFFAGHQFSSSSFTKRLAARFYIYHSPNFQFAQEGVCTNAKLMQFTSNLIDVSFGYVHAYNFLASDGWSPGMDCCVNGPGRDNLTKADWRGKWWRVEAIQVNRAGPNWRLLVYMKNVTDNGPELTVVDTAMAGTAFNSGASWMPPKRQDQMLINNYRETGCTGWLGISHYIMAGWDTDSGQRIGGAVEIEGPQGALSAPTNLTVR